TSSLQTRPRRLSPWWRCRVLRRWLLKMLRKPLKQLLLPLLLHLLKVVLLLLPALLPLPVLLLLPAPTPRKAEKLRRRTRRRSSRRLLINMRTRSSIIERVFFVEYEREQGLGVRSDRMERRKLLTRSSSMVHRPWSQSIG